jgi:hypothetical protein
MVGTFLRTIIGIATVAVLATGSARAASTTNYSDQWWIAAESGWGASVLQQWDTLFIDFFVYGADTKPTWFVAAGTRQPGSPAGHDVFAGDLFVTTGPYYGAPFDPAAASGRKAGTLTFDADSTTTATLSYTVDGTSVVKSVTRQTWRLENIGGDHYGGIVVDRTECANPDDNGRAEFAVNIRITHPTDNMVTLLFEVGGGGCALTGLYSQAGHMGQILNGRDSCSPASLALDVYEIERSLAGTTGRWRAVNPGPPDGDGCKAAGRFGGVRR